MISFDEAYEKATSLMDGIDHCTEYETAFVFGNLTGDEIGGWRSGPVVILKEDGKAICMPEFIVNHDSAEIRTIKL